MFNNLIKEASASTHLSYSLVVPFVLRLHVLLIPQRTSLLTVLSPFQEEQIISNKNISFESLLLSNKLCKTVPICEPLLPLMSFS